ncbi:hypothetical protein GQ607_006102 [Colletotrichum asianum]|uniref:Uncharacterized protein n=1 Tax=Colletotrichum asianum TaxID=702518 RepID=A0A8H3WLK5_9PEZI|nr:hypothetical protein GQ607_006102 [Colletotrichum asianum]
MAVGFTPWATKPRSPVYSKIYADDLEAPPSPGFRTRKSSRWLHRLSPKAMLGLVASVFIFSCLVVTAVSKSSGSINLNLS